MLPDASALDTAALLTGGAGACVDEDAGEF